MKISGVFELPVALQTGYTSYLFHALPMCVLKAYPQYDPWLFENDVNIHMPHFQLIFYSYQANGFLGFSADELFCLKRLHHDFLYSDICFELEQQLTQGYYAYIVLDEFYLSQKKFYNISHRFHDSLIYGIDYSTSEFLAITDGATNGVLQKVRYPYDELIQAYIAIRNIPHAEDSVVFFMPYKDFAHIFSAEKYLRSLIEYVNGIHPDHLIYLYRAVRETSTCYGIDVYGTFADLLGEKKQLDFYDFRNIHFLYQHKNNLLKSLQYLIDTQIVTKDFVDMLLSFVRTADVISQIRSQFLKYLELQRQDFPIKRLNDIKQKIIHALREYRTQERESVIEITEYLKRYIAAPQGNLQKTKHLPEYSFEKDYQRDLVSTADVKILTDEKEQSGYSYHYRFQLSWPNPVVIRRIRLKCRGLVRASLNNIEETFSANTFSEDDWEYRLLELNKTSSSLTLDIFSMHHIAFDDLDLMIIEGSLTWGKTLTVSSVWLEENGNPLYTCLPENALTYCTDRFWNAQNHFPGREYLEVDLGDETTMDRIVVQERPDVSRICRYVIDAHNDDDVKIRIAEHTGSLESKPVIHDFPRMKARYLRLTVLETVACRHGFTEPGIATFEAYCFPESST